MSSPPVTRRLIATTGPLVAVLVIAGCAGGSASDRSVARNGLADGPSVASRVLSGSGGTGHTSADVDFARAMVPRHRQAIELADTVLRRTADPEVKTVATQIGQAESARLTTVTTWLTGWGVAVPTGDTVPAPGADDDALGPGQLAELAAARGTDADRLFLSLMIDHDQAVVQAAETALAGTPAPQVRTLAASMKAAQSEQVVQLQNMLLSLG